MLAEALLSPFGQGLILQAFYIDGGLLVIRKSELLSVYYNNSSLGFGLILEQMS